MPRLGQLQRGGVKHRQATTGRQQLRRRRRINQHHVTRRKINPGTGISTSEQKQ